MFELHVSNPDVSGGTIPVSWCVNKELLEYLAQAKISDPQVVIVVAPEENYSMKKEWRTVVPLKDLMTYIEFRCPGKNKIYGFIGSEKSWCKDIYLAKTARNFISTILTYDGTDYLEGYKNCAGDTLSKAAPPIQVDVPADCFAPEPYQWEKNWVNAFFSDKCVDQCDFRKRRIFAYTVQPLIMIGILLVHLFLLTIATLLGARNWSWKYLLHPMSYSPIDALDMFEEGSIFIKKEDELRHVDGFTYLWKKFKFLPFMPLVLAILFIFYKLHILTLVVSALVLLAVLVSLIVALVTARWSGIPEFFISKFFNKANETWYLNPKETELLICNGQKKPTSIKDIPSNRRSIRLIFSAVKSKVCRPFSA